MFYADVPFSTGDVMLNKGIEATKDKANKELVQLVKHYARKAYNEDEGGTNVLLTSSWNENKNPATQPFPSCDPLP